MHTAFFEGKLLDKSLQPMFSGFQGFGLSQRIVGMSTKEDNESSNRI